MGISHPNSQDSRPASLISTEGDVARTLTGGRTSALGAFGASIVLLSIALDPFFQQVVVYPSRSAVVGSSTILRSILYTAGRLDPYYRSDGYQISYPDRAIKYYVEPLLYFNVTPELPTVPLTCSTGECTWEPYNTLGVCNECADLSHLIEFACLESQIDWTSDIMDGASATYPKRQTCGYYMNTTSSDPMLMTGYEAHSGYNETLLGRTLPLNLPTNHRQGYFNGSIMFKDIGAPIVDAVYVFTPGGHDAVKRNTTPIARECNLRWCVQQVNSTVHAGVLHETILSTIDNRTVQPYAYYEDWSDWVMNYYNDPRITVSSTNESYGPETNDTAALVTLSFFASMRAMFTFHNVTTGNLMRYTELGSEKTFTVSSDHTFWANPYNVSTHFDNIAKALSRVVRVSGNGTEEVKGDALGPQTYVMIRWEWFSLPVILLGFSLVFLVSVMIQCRSNEVKIWKTSALAVLLHGPGEGGSRGQSDPLSTVDGYGASQMEHGTAKVRLHNINGSWRFSQDEPS